MNERSKTILTNKEFWEDEWKNLDLPIILEPSIRADRSFINLFNKHLSIVDGKNKTCLEIGCNPGKFLIYCAKFLNYDIYGIDFEEKGCLLTEKNLKAVGINGSISQQDIFNLDTNQKFDLILSCGFIEHFAGVKLDEVLKIHVDLLKENGKLFLSVPNFRYLNYVFSYFFRKNMLDHHNLKIMQKSFFIDFAEKNNLTNEYLGYFGGIHPGGLKLGTKNIFKKFITKNLINRIEKYQILDRINSKYFSHHIGVVLVKN